MVRIVAAARVRVGDEEPMSVVLFVVGLLITAAGFVTIGFGIPINAFSLGNTLIISGTVAVCSGLILIGLSMAVRQLSRIAAALRSQAGMPKAVRPVAHEVSAGESLVPPTAKLTPVAARQAAAPAPSFAPPPRAQESAPMQPAPMQSAPMSSARPAEHRMSEHRVAAPPAEEEKGPLQWLRKKPSAPAAPAQGANDPSMLDIADEAPLSPRPPRLPFTTPPMATEPAMEPRSWPQPGRDAGELKPVSRNEQIPRVAPQMDPAKDKMFDVVWPDGRHTPPPVVPEPAAQEYATRREAQVEMPPPPPMPTMRRDEPVADKPSDELPLPPANERTPAVLKSGVIDGMAYTLYADGSIEADLPNGVVKFASVDALRAHLEKQT